MKKRFEGVTAFIKDKAEKATQSVNAFVESDDAKAAVAWTKNAVSIATDEAVELGKRAAQSELAKDAATGAGIGAVSQGISLFIVQEILGHSDPKITMRYSHVANKTLLDASNKASDFIKAAMPINVAIPMELPLLVDLAISEPVEVAVAA